MGLLMADEIEKKPDDEVDVAAADTPEVAAEPPAPDQRLDPPQADIAEPSSDFDRGGYEQMIAEYDSAMQAQQQVDVDSSMSTEELLAGDADRARAELEDDQDNLPRLESLEQQNAELLHAQREQRGWADFEALTAKIQETMPRNFPVREYLLGRLAQNPGAMLLWDNRHDERALVRLDYILKQERRRMGDIAAEMERPGIDADATADREMIVQALRSGRGNYDPAEPPPRFGNMSDREFTKTVEEKYGFNPRV
jgi:hypothetical protein